jgi:hypothetical protein
MAEELGGVRMNLTSPESSGDPQIGMINIAAVRFSVRCIDPIGIKK